MGLEVKHVSFLQCSCGAETGAETKPDWGETDLGSTYSKLSFKMPEGWSYYGCPPCTVKEKAEQQRQWEERKQKEEARRLEKQVAEQKDRDRYS